MATLPEMIDLFSRLALHLHSPGHTSTSDNEREVEEESINLSISKLNRSLNLSADPSVRVLDTALSLMCFEAPKVLDSFVNYSVNTIVSVLSASIACKVLRHQNEEVLQIGSSISRRDCVELIEACNNVLDKLERRGMPAHLLLRAVVRVAALASCYRFSFPLMVSLDATSSNERSTIMLNLLRHLPIEFSLQNDEIPLRLLFWYLDPLTLKHDVFKILQDTSQRPFLYLNAEFRERSHWRTVAICLVLSPVMFVQTRALLHNWFLLTGLASILELLVELVSAVLDIISCPTSWGISLEVGAKLPFSSAYFPFMNELLRILSGPLSTEGLLCIVHIITNPFCHAKHPYDPTIDLSTTKDSSVDHRSVWDLAISFPDWFCFASVLLFTEKSFQENFHLECKIPQTGKMHEELAFVVAARYIAWILSPINKSKQQLLVEFLTNMSETWSRKQYGLGKNHKEEIGYRKKLKKLKFDDKDYTAGKEYSSRMIGNWIQEFESSYVQYSIKIAQSCTSADITGSQGFGLQKDVMLTRIPLGILVGSPNCIDEEGYATMLHYAATGKINQLNCSVEFSKSEAVMGACLVFGLTDIVERMSVSLFETDERAVEFIYQVKTKAIKYLMKCIKGLIQLDIEEIGVVMLKDLSCRLMRWRHQGEEIVQVDELDYVINVLSERMPSI